jgi:hypothetical protein
MSQAETIVASMPVQRRPVEYTSAAAVSIPWGIWLMGAGLTLGSIAAAWDFAWHESIGRDTLFTPPHVTMWTSAVLVAIAGVYEILATTFGGATPEREFAIQVLRVHAPTGVFIAVWGSVAMLASTPFDNWWHNAYGLDVSIVTPPHMVAALGTLASKAGAMAWIASTINRSHGAPHRRLTTLFLFLGSLMVGELSVIIIDPTWRTEMHTAGCYLAIALFIPTMMLCTGWGSARKWGCTMVGALYMSLAIGLEWLLPLVPAQPKLGPVYHNLTHLIPLRFPMLLLVPGFISDLVLQKLAHRSSWIKAVWVGPAFVLSFLAVQWPFADFLMSPASRNWIFGSAYYAYMDPAEVLYNPYVFHAAEKPFAMFVLILASALLVSILTTRLGLAWGDWLRRVCR